MRIAHFANRSFNSIASLRPCRSVVNRSLSTNVEKDDYFEKLFGGYTGNDENSSAFFQHLGRAEKEVHSWKNMSTSGGSRFSAGSSVNRGNGDQSFDSSSDGMDGKLKEAALFFKVDEEEGAKDSYLFRSDAANSWGGNFKPRNVTPRARQNNEFKITTEAVLKQADFRNVKFLAKFITEAGIIIKRKQTGISAKAQRKIAREIKTARAFGLMPFTTMGTKAFVFGKTMENRDEDFEYEALDDDYDEE